MPYYNWHGIDWFGKIHSGKLLARSKFDLERMLLKIDLGIISSKQILHKSLLKPIKFSQKVNFFKELSILINSGVLLPNALTVVKQQIKHSDFKMAVEEIEFEVQEGHSFADVISKFSYVFDYLTIQILKAGEESGKLGDSLISISSYLEQMEKFMHKLRSVILLPAITFSVFLFISSIIFIFIIPSFVSIFQFSNQQIPPMTQKLLSVSYFLKSNGLFVIFIVLFFIALAFRVFLKNKKGKRLFDKVLTYMPFIGFVVKNINITYFLQSTSLLLAGGVHLIKSLEITCNLVKNEYLKKYFFDLFYSIEAGNSLSEAMIKNRSNLFQPNLIAIVKVGEETGNLTLMLNKASKIYFDKLNSLLSLFLTVIQPILMVILGLLIALLIFAVYIPLFNLPNIIKY